MSWPVAIESACSCCDGFALTRDQAIALVMKAAGRVPVWLAEVFVDRLGDGLIHPWRFLYILAEVKVTRLIEGRYRAVAVLALRMQQATGRPGAPPGVTGPAYHLPMERCHRAVHLDAITGRREPTEWAN